MLDLRAGPWDALGRLAQLRSLKLNHRKVYSYASYEGPPPPDPPAELPPEALPSTTEGYEMGRMGRLGWLLDLYPHLAPPGVEGGGEQGGGAGNGPVEGQPQQVGPRQSERPAAPQQQGRPAKPPAFRLAWLPPGLQTCELDLPWGTRVDRGGGPQGDGASGLGSARDRSGVAEPPPPGHLARFQVQWGAYVLLP